VLEKIQSTVITSGQTKSAELRTGYRTSVVAVITPASLTGSAFTFEGSLDGTTFVPVYNEATQYSVNVGTSRYVALNAAVFQGLQSIKVVSGSAEGADRTIQIVLKEIQ
jgi:hypothetical protein